MAWAERYASVAGAGAHDGLAEASAWTFAEAIANGAGKRVNIKGTPHARTTTTDGVPAGTTTVPTWFRGYVNTIGDIDLDPTLAKPEISYTSGLLNVNQHVIVSNLSVTSTSTTGPAISVNGAAHLHRCRVENTGANALSRAVGISATATVSECWLKAPGTATSIVNNTSIGLVCFDACEFEGGGHGIGNATGVFLVVKGCEFKVVGGDGVNLAATPAVFVCDGSTFYSCGSDGIEFAAMSTTHAAAISNCVFANNAGWGINNSSGANTNLVKRFNNAFYLNTSGKEQGFGDNPSLAEVVEVGSPFTNPPADMTLARSALAVGKASPYPGPFENQNYSNFRDIGALQLASIGLEDEGLSFLWRWLW